MQRKQTVTVSLAAAWKPRGEIPRLQRLLPQLRQVYHSICVSVPPDARTDDVRQLEQLHIALVITRDWSHGRHAAMQRALQTSATHIHYADMDRLLRWVETRPDEWQQTIARVQQCDCLIVGRTARAYRTHPQALVQTEAISNLVGSCLLGTRINADERGQKEVSSLVRARLRPIDLSAGSRGFSRRAAEFLMTHSPPGRALGMDAEWPILLRRAGFTIDYVEVDGLDWESADRCAERAADADAQRRTAEAYDADVRHWARRVEVALEIVRAGVEAMQRDWSETP